MILVIKIIIQLMHLQNLQAKNEHIFVVFFLGTNPGRIQVKMTWCCF